MDSARLLKHGGRDAAENRGVARTSPSLMVSVPPTPSTMKVGGAAPRQGPLGLTAAAKRASAETQPIQVQDHAVWGAPTHHPLRCLHGTTRKKIAGSKGRLFCRGR